MFKLGGKGSYLKQRLGDSGNNITHVPTSVHLALLNPFSTLQPERFLKCALTTNLPLLTNLPWLPMAFR